jgi:hypothetical protein
MPLWLIPMLYVGVTAVGGFVLPPLVHEFLEAYSHSTSVSSAQAILSAIAAGMMALTGIVFPSAFVGVQFSAVAWIPILEPAMGYGAAGVQTKARGLNADKADRTKPQQSSVRGKGECGQESRG